jgi:hypothetical protein
MPPRRKPGSVARPLRASTIRAQASVKIPSLLRGEKGDHDGRPRQPSRAGERNAAVGSSPSAPESPDRLDLLLPRGEGG